VKKFCWYLNDFAFEGTRIFTLSAAPSCAPSAKPPNPLPAQAGDSFGYPAGVPDV